MLIGFTGKKRSGKDTAANFLVRTYGYEKIAFADPLRECLEALNPVVDMITGDRYAEYVSKHGYEEAKKNPEVRRLLQVFGTEVCREILGEALGNPWTVIVAEKIRKAKRQGTMLAISDVRFDDEAELIHTHGGRVIEIFGGQSCDTDSHVSEKGVSAELIDRRICNDGPLSLLEGEIVRAIKRFKGRET